MYHSSGEDTGRRKTAVQKDGRLVRVFMLRILVVLCICQMVLTIWFFSAQKSTLLASLEGKMALNAGLLASAAASSGTAGPEYIRRVAYGLLEDEEFLSIKVTGADGKVLMEAKKSDAGGDTEAGLFFIPETNVLSLPVISGGKESGRVEIIFSGRAVNRQLLHVLLVTLFAQAGFFLLIMLVIAVTFKRQVADRISVIEERVSRVREGDLSVSVPEMKGDEIGSIARGIRFLIDSLSSTIEKLKATSSNVFKAVRQLKVTFEHVEKRVRDQKGEADEVAELVAKANESQVQIATNTDEVLITLNENVASLHEMKAAAEEVSASASKLLASTEISYSSVDEMTHQARNIKERTNGVLNSLQETAVSVDEINATVQEVKRNAKVSTELVEKVASLVSGTGKQSVDDAVTGMKEIADEVNHTFGLLKKLGGHSRDIEKILKIIREVTEKTNLLSLNAAIIASQAGEYGRSFSVIADEMRTLSERTEASTRDIAEIVKVIQSYIQQTLESFKKEMESVTRGNHLVLKVGDTLKEILDASAISADMARKIEQATDEQAAGLAQITVTIDTIKNEAESVNAAVDEQYKGISYLLENAGEVKEIAEIVSRATSEQAEGTDLISRNIDIASQKLKEIAEANREQKEINDMILEAVRKIQETGFSTMKSVGDVSAFFERLRGDVESLNRDMGSFRLKKA